MALPDFSAMYPNRDPTMPISVHELQPYIKKHGAIFRSNRQVRQETKDYFFTRNHVGAVCSIQNPEDMLILTCLGAECFRTLSIEVHPTNNAIVLANIISYAYRLKHLTFDVISGSGPITMPSEGSSQAEMRNFLGARGLDLLQVLKNVKDVNFNFFGQSTVDAYIWEFNAYLKGAFENRIAPNTTMLNKLIMGALNISRPKVHLATLHDDFTFAN